METLSKSYEELYYKSKDFDARLFLVDDETLSSVKTEVYVLHINLPFEKERKRIWPESSLSFTWMFVVN